MQSLRRLPPVRRSAGFFLALALAVVALPVTAKDPMPWKGGPTPALALEDMRGRPVRLEDYKGKVVLVNFWATWCEPCREEMPSLQQLKQHLAGKPFEVLAVNLAEPRSRVEAFLARAPFDFPILLDQSGEVSRNWRARILPVTFLIGPDGRIRYSHTGVLDWAEPRLVEKISALMPRR